MAIARRRRGISDILDDYFRDLEKELEGWREAFAERPSWNLKAGTMEPLRDMRITPTEVVVTVDLPLTNPGTMQVKPSDENMLEISAEMKRKVKFKEMGITHQKGEFQRFHCHTRVPVPVKMDEMKIRFKKGMLEIHLPRKHRHGQ
jgi:HSP20 family molecular chaperone IbpA